MTRRHVFFSTVAAGGVVCLIATTVISCSKDKEATPTAPTAAAVTTVTSVVVSASATSLTVGESATMSAMATYSDETSAEITPTWGSSAPGVATVSASGIVTAVASGTTMITGTIGGQQDSVLITVTTVTTVTSVVVSASATILTAGASATMSAVATYSDGTSAEITPTWGSSAPGVATVSAAGIVTAVASGATMITGTIGGQQDSVPIIVTTPNADDILARCPTPSEVAVSDADLNLIFESDPTAGQIVCTAEQSSRDLTLLEAQVYRVLTIMRQLEFDAALPWTAHSLYGWMVSSIDSIRLRGDIGTSFCCSPANTINIQTQNLSALSIPTDFRYVGTLLVLFVHEARHNNGKPHTCGSSDNTIAELGAWGVQYYMNLFLGTHSDQAFITPTMQSTFTQNAQSVCSGRFCQDSCP